MSILDTNVTVLQVNKETIDKPFEVGYRGDHNAYKLVFSDLVGDGYSVLFWKPMAKPCIAVPLVNNEWLLGNEVLSTSGTLYCQVVKKDESNNFIKHSQVFMLSVNESAPCTHQAFEEVPPNFKIAYDEMVAITKKVNEALTGGKFNGLSAYELAVKNGFKGTEAEWIESLKYWNSPEFTKLAEQVRADKKHVDTVVADFDKKANQANTDFDTKVDTANTEFDKKVVNANSAFDKKVTDADTNFTNKVNKANTDLDTKVTQINSDLNAKETTINQALDTKIDGANSVIDAKVQESATSAENAKQSELKAQSIADNMQGLSDAFRIDTNEQGRVITATDSADSVINGLKVFGESMQVQSTGANLLDPDAITKIQVNVELNGIELALEEGKYTVSINDKNNPGHSIYMRIRRANSELTGITYLITPQTVMSKYTLTLQKGEVILIYDATTTNSIELTKSVFKSYKIMVNKGDSVLPYEPYTGGKVAPSPELPQEVISKVVNSVTLLGRNLVNIPPITVDTPQTVIDCKLIGTIVVNAEHANNNNNNVWRINLRRKDGTAVNITDENLKNNTISKLKVIATFNNPIVSITYRGTNIIGSGYDRIMVAYGETIQPYEPYKEPQVVTLSKPVTLNGVLEVKSGNVTIDGKQYVSDVITEKDGVYGVERYNFTTIIDNPPKVYTYNSQKGFSINNVLPTELTRRMGFCTNFKVVMSVAASDSIRIGEGTTNIYFLQSSFYNQDLEDKGLQNFKDYLSKNKFEIMTYHDAPTFEPLPEADQQALKALKSNCPTTVVVNNDNAFMQLDYVADTKNYIDNRLAEIKTALIASKGV